MSKSLKDDNKNAIRLVSDQELTVKLEIDYGVYKDFEQEFYNVKINKKILIVATPNVQKNFELQLFDKTKFKLQMMKNIKEPSGKFTTYCFLTK